MHQWARRYQEEELASLRSELDKVLREVEAETELLGDREAVIRGIREEQRQVRGVLHSFFVLHIYTARLKVRFLVFFPTSEPSHSRGAPEVPESLTLVAQYLTRYKT